MKTTEISVYAFVYKVPPNPANGCVHSDSFCQHGSHMHDIFPELFKWKLQPILKIALVVSITVLLAYSMRKQIINPNLVSIEFVVHPD